MDNLIINKRTRTYLPTNLKVEWESLAPIFDELLSRNLNNVEELEQWLKDKSELEAALEEDFAWRYIKMSCDTANENLVKDFQYFATEIEPKISPIANELNIKLTESKYIDQLGQDKYFVYLRAVKKALELYREENIELFTQLQVAQQKYQGITGAMSVTLNGKEYTLEQASNFLKDTDRNVRQQAWETIQQRRLGQIRTNSIFCTMN
jgi:oligoendopeptidase F